MAWEWEYAPETERPIAIVDGKTDILVAMSDNFSTWIDIRLEHEKLIIQAVNSHDALTAALDRCVEALEEIYDHAMKYRAAPFSAENMFSRARAALEAAKKARG